MRGTQSLKNRYIAKLSSNLIGMGIGVITSAIIPRGLGPEAYGNFNFLTNFFSQLLPVFVFGTSIGFYTKISQRQTEFGLISFYGKFNGLAILMMFLLIILSHLLNLDKVFWPDQKLTYIYMAAIFSTFTWILALLSQIGDAFGLTISIEITRIFQKIIGIIIILSLYLLTRLNLTNFLLYNYFISFFLISAYIFILNRNGLYLFQSWKLTKQQLRNYSKEFYQYSHPLFFYTIIGVISGLLSRWLLQKFAGSIQQGFFGLSYQIGAICFLFTSAMTSLITREFSIAYKNENIKEMAYLFRRYIPMLYAVAAFFGCFTSVQSVKITYLFGGIQYTSAVIPVMIMALYPIHQTYGQLSGSVFFASGQTKLYRNIGLVFMLLGLPLTFFALAPKEKLGLNSGATGLATIFVLLQFVQINVQLFYNSKFLKLSFYKYFIHQVICVVILIITALISKLLVDNIFPMSNIILQFCLSGILYSIFVLILTYHVPAIFGLYKNDINFFLLMVSSRLKKIINLTKD